MADRVFKLSPSDFGFLWKECKRCFYLKVARGFDRPPMPFPKVFNTIDRRMKECFGGTRSEEMAAGAPAGTIEFGDGWVQSEPLDLPGHPAACYIRGIFDAVVKLDDGGYAVVDFKTTEARPSLGSLYSRQLHAYAIALEHPAKGFTERGPVSRLGLLVYGPDRFTSSGSGRASLEGKLAWVEIERDDDAFTEFLSEVVEMLKGEAPPDSNPDCPMCRYRNESRRTEL